MIFRINRLIVTIAHFLFLGCFVTKKKPYLITNPFHSFLWSPGSVKLAKLSSDALRYEGRGGSFKPSFYSKLVTERVFRVLFRLLDTWLRAFHRATVYRKRYRAGDLHLQIFEAIFLKDSLNLILGPWWVIY